METCKKNGVVNSVKSSREVEEREKRYLFSVSGKEKIVKNTQEGSGLPILIRPRGYLYPLMNILEGIFTLSLES